MKNAFAFWVIVAAAVISLTCSEAPEVGIPNPGPGGGTPILTLTNEERLEVLKECSEFVHAIGNDLTSDIARQALLTWLRTRPEFEDADITEGTVWAYFYDGRMVMFIPNWEGLGDEGGRLAASEWSGRLDQDGAGRTSGLPENNGLFLFYGLGKAFKDDRAYLESMFKKSHTRYQPELLDASVENLRHVKDLGIFYIRTHGGLGMLKPKSEQKAMFSLWTTDSTTLENEEAFEADLNSGFLTYGYAVDDDPNTSEWHYGITEAFVRYHMTFAENAIQYIDACNGMNPMASKFRQTMIQKAKNGQATYIGWTNPKSGVESIPTTRYVVDRLLGTHDNSVPMEEPDQRPFDWASVFDDMSHWNLGVSQAGGKLAYQSQYASPVILTPSIEYIFMDEYNSRMVIKGLFGENTLNDGKVTVDGFPAVIQAWTPTFIFADIPVKGPGSFGNVLVSVRGNESNKVPLSKWTIPMTFTRDEFGFRTVVNAKLVLRGDVHRYRSKIGEAPRTIRPDSLGVLASPALGFAFSGESSATFNAGGSRQQTCNIAGCEIFLSESISSRSGNMPFAAFPIGLAFGAYYKWSEDMKKIRVTLIANVPDLGYEFRKSAKCPGTNEATTEFSQPYQTGINIPYDDLPYLEVNLDSSHDVQAGSVTRSSDAEWGLCMVNDKIVLTVQWPGVQVQAPPDANTESRIGH